MTATESILTRAGADVVQRLRDSMTQSGVNATGNASKSIRADVFRNGTTTSLTVSALRYIFTVEEGRKPSKPGKTVPYAKILAWVRAKGLQTNDPQGLAWGIKKKIDKEGTLTYRRYGRYGRGSGILSSVLNDRTIEDILARIGNIIADAALRTKFRDGSRID